MFAKEKYDSEDTYYVNQSVVNLTLLDDSLTGTVFDQRHGVKNITVGRNDIYLYSQPRMCC